MRRVITRRQQRWAAAGLWVFFIYSTLALVRPVCEALRSAMPFAVFVNGVLVFALGAVFVWKRNALRSLKTSSGVLLLVVVFMYGWFLQSLTVPEEKVHLLEYGILAVLIYRALRCDCSPWVALAWAQMLTSLLGFGDEGIQYFLPNRYFEWKDVGLNAVSAVLALLLTCCLTRRGET